MNKMDENKAKVPSGVILIILLLAAVAAPLSLNKVSPIAPNLMQNFGIGETQIGMLISVFSLTGIVLALPGGLMIRKFGPWKCVLAALFALLIGSIIGTYSNSFTELLISRIIEGIGMALIAVAGPSIIGITVSQKRRGVAMGLFSAYIGIGQVLTYNLAPRIIISGGWQGVWWFATIYIIVCILIWVLLMFRLKAFSQKQVETQIPETQISSFSSVFKNKSLWYLSISMAFYIISFASIQTFLPSYLSSDRGMDMTSASSLVSICCFTGTVFSLVAGILSDKLGSRRIFGGLSLIISSVLFALIIITPTSSYSVLVVILGLVPPILPVCVFAAASEVVDDPSAGSMAMGLISMGQNIGYVAGPILFGAITQQFGWNAAFIFTIPIAIIGGVIMLFNKKVR